MAAALEAVSLQTGLQPFYADGIVAGKQSPALKGNYSKREARPIFMSATLGRPTTSCRAGPAGDGNGYVGDLNLKPEVANTISITGDWHDRTRQSWGFKVTPYYTHVQDYIGVVQEQYDIVSSPAPGVNVHPGGAGLRFANHAAQLYGVDVSGDYTLWNSPDYGRFALTGVGGFAQGDDLDNNHTGLWHMMPFNIKSALEHKLGGWANVVELQIVDSKTRVDAARREMSTPSYALLNLRTNYDWKHVRLDLGINNLFDTLYYSPLGGLDWAQMKYNNPKLTTANFNQATRLNVPGEGRSLFVGLTVKF
jgi:iron complex outermembrane receptor protein